MRLTLLGWALRCRFRWRDVLGVLMLWRLDFLRVRLGVARVTLGRLILFVSRRGLLFMGALLILFVLRWPRGLRFSGVCTRCLVILRVVIIRVFIRLVRLAFRNGLLLWLMLRLTLRWGRVAFEV